MVEFLNTDFVPLESEKTAQQLAVLDALRKGPCSTLTLRNLFISHPAARVLELRKQGWNIITRRSGRFALYALQSGGAA
jgi:hypothetical protein